MFNKHYLIDFDYYFLMNVYSFDEVLPFYFIFIIFMFFTHVNAFDKISTFDVYAEKQLYFGKSDLLIKTLFNDAYLAVSDGNFTKAIQNIQALFQTVSKLNQTSEKIQTTELLVDDVLESLDKNDTKRIMLYMDLIGQQLGIDKETNSSLQQKSSNSEYINKFYGIKISYPMDWNIRNYQYFSDTNNTIVGIYSKSKIASELGNISGVSGHFVPYLDIYTFNSNNMSLDDIVDLRRDKIKNNTNFDLLEAKKIVMNGSLSAYELVYTVITGGDEHFKKIQVYTMYNNNIYLITFTAQDALFSQYEEQVKKMIDSFEISNVTSIKT